MSKVIQQREGKRLKSGLHTGYAIIKHNGKYFVSTESGTRPATRKEIKQMGSGGYDSAKM